MANSVKVKGVQATVNQLNIAIQRVSNRLAVTGVKEACFYVATLAAHETPVDTSTLLNSQFTDVTVEGDRIVGRIGYTAPYAGFVHDAPGKYLTVAKLRPVPFGQAPGSHGFLWDPNGNPKFLFWPLEDSKQEVREIIARRIRSNI